MGSNKHVTNLLISPLLRNEGSTSLMSADDPGTSTGTKHLHGHDTWVHESNLASKAFRDADLKQARDILCKENPYLISLRMEDLWNLYPSGKLLLAGVKSHLIQIGRLSQAGELIKDDGVEIHEDQFAHRVHGATEDKTFAFFPPLFNAVLEFLQQSGHATHIEEMVHAGTITPVSTQQS